MDCGGRVGGWPWYFHFCFKPGPALWCFVACTWGCVTPSLWPLEAPDPGRWVSGVLVGASCSAQAVCGEEVSAVTRFHAPRGNSREVYSRMTFGSEWFAPDGAVCDPVLLARVLRRVPGQGLFCPGVDEA